MAVVDNAFETKGTHLYFADFISDTDGVATKLTCPTGITGTAGGTRDKIDTTCLDETGSYRKFIGGFSDAQELSAPFVLYKGDPSHQAMVALKRSGDVINWMVCLSDSAAAPTLDTDGKLVTPADRTTFAFDGYVSNITFDAAVNEVIRGTLTIQPTGDTIEHWAA